MTQQPFIVRSRAIEEANIQRLTDSDEWMDKWPDDITKMLKNSDPTEWNYSIFVTTFQQKEKEALLDALHDLIRRHIAEDPGGYVEIAAMEESEIGVVLELGLEEYRRKYGNFQ